MWQNSSVKPFLVLMFRFSTGDVAALLLASHAGSSMQTVHAQHPQPSDRYSDKQLRQSGSSSAEDRAESASGPA